MSTTRKRSSRSSGVPGWALLCAALFLIANVQPASGQEKGAPPAPRAIPGINAEDAFPGGCVDCHRAWPEMDVRLSTLLKHWEQEVPPALLAKAQNAAPAGVTLKGKHPAAPEALAKIPAGCLKCHGRASTKAPPFARLLHAIHLTGGDQNHFLTMFNGECTHCHKLDAATGAWSFSNGSEK